MQFQTLAAETMEMLRAAGGSTIVTGCPHCLHTFLRDYRPLDETFSPRVLHHSQLIAELIGTKKIRPSKVDDERTYTFHDPCYLGRHNGVYEEPRQVLAALPGLKTVEMDRSRNRSFCCGGGSLNLFFENEGETRMGERRIEMALESGAQVVVTGCPFCLINLEDAVKTSGREDEIEVIDLAELVAQSL